MCRQNANALESEVIERLRQIMPKKGQKITTIERAVFSLLGGVFTYFIASLPLILFRLFPPIQPKGLNIQYTTLYPPKIDLFILSFGASILLAMYVFAKLNFGNRFTHFVALGSVLALSGGFLNGIAEVVFFVFIIGDEVIRETFFATLSSDYVYGFKYSIEWIIVFLVAMILFTVFFLIVTAITSKYVNKPITAAFLK